MVAPMPSEVRLVTRGRLLAATGQGRELRVRAGIGLRELARLLGVDPATVTRWERGIHRPLRGHAAERYARALEEIEQELKRPGALTPGHPGDLVAASNSPTISAWGTTGAEQLGDEDTGDPSW